ncbi:MAG: hypothetical protein J0G94_09805 [Sphingomonadales bacterium]|nr:hypothetical protein [Sphingomonadales bacterium]
MSFRIYLAIALAILGMAPFLANLASNAVPAAQHAADTREEDEHEMTEAAAEVTPHPAETLPAPLPEPRRASAQSMAQLAGNAEPLMSAEPTLDATGIGPGGIGSVAPPAPVRPAPRPSEAVVPPPPPSVPLSQRY